MAELPAAEGTPVIATENSFAHYQLRPDLSWKHATWRPGRIVFRAMLWVGNDYI